MPKTTAPPHIHRDVSWLSFNNRVLQEAKDPAVPLAERLKFLAIYSNNLDEYFRVRVAGHRNLLRVGKKTKRELDYDPKEVMQRILEIVNHQQLEFTRIFEQEIIPQLSEHGIHLLRRLDLNDEQEEFVEDYFHDHMLPYVQPVLLVRGKIRPFLENAGIYLSILMRDKDLDGEGRSEYALVKIPSDQLPRFIELPAQQRDRRDFIMLDDIVRQSVSWMFPGYEIQDTYSIKLTRDAELYIDDEFSGDLVSKIRSSLAKRHVGPASRFVYDRTMPNKMLRFLMHTFGLEKFDLFPEGRYHNNFDFFKFTGFADDSLKNEPLPPIPYAALEDAETKDEFWSAIRERDHLIHPPFHSYESVVRFFEHAAADPDVTHIKIIQYRVAGRSRIMKALMRAVQAGKQVFAFIEVKARFDEEANLSWGEKLEKAGVRVHYSWPGVKVHSKLAFVRRVENGRGTTYTYLGTGNFHEDTAKIYSDLGILTADRRLTNEVARVFSYLETSKRPPQDFKHLLVGKFNLTPGLIRLVDDEIAAARAGKEARIVLKMNSLQDDLMIQKLYEASQAGVEVRLIIRGICSLVPGVPGFSDNIQVISIVDRFLEHARIFHFCAGGKNKLYLSSADWMTRNLFHRIETCFPVYDERIKQKLLQLLDVQWADNVKARFIDADSTNTYKRTGADMAVRSQIETYHSVLRWEMRERAEREEAAEVE